MHALFLDCGKVSTDTRKIKQGDMFFALKGENFNGNTFARKALELGAKYVIIDEEDYYLDSRTILVNNGLIALQELANFHRKYLKKPIIGLTGSNGKTTTKELINAVLSKKYNTTATAGNLNNHIGVPLTLLSITCETEIGIIEMGANHQKEIEFLSSIAEPDYGYITNFGKAHLEGFGGVDGVIKGKSELYQNLRAHKKMAFINANDPIQVEKTKEIETFSFGTSNTVNDVSIDLISANPFAICRFEDLTIETKLIGEYNFANICAAIAIGKYLKVSSEEIKLAIENYVPSNNRSQILDKGNTKIILDAYNANPTSMRAALLNFEKQSGNKIAILGDMFELGKEAEKEHQAIADLAVSLHIEKIYFVGNNFHESEVDSEKAKKFESFEAFKSEIKLIEFGNSTLLIKGSRGMALERVLDLLE